MEARTRNASGKAKVLAAGVFAVLLALMFAIALIPGQASAEPENGNIPVEEDINATPDELMALAEGDLGDTVENVHLENGDTFAAVDAENIALLTNQRTGDNTNLIPLYKAFRDVDDTAVIHKFRQQLLFVLIEWAVEVIHMQDNVEAREPFDVIYKFFDVFCLDKDVRGEENDFYEPAAAAEIMTLEPIWNQAAGIKRGIGKFINHLPCLFFASRVCPEYVIHVASLREATSVRS